MIGFVTKHALTRYKNDFPERKLKSEKKKTKIQLQREEDEKWFNGIMGACQKTRTQLLAYMDDLNKRHSDCSRFLHAEKINDRKNGEKQWRKTMKKVKPITPEEAMKGRDGTEFPSEVIASFNELIKKNLKGKSAVIKRNEVISLILSKFAKNKKYAALTDHEICDHNWLNVEFLFRNLGWKVVYDQPAYCENYEAYFEFTCK